MADRDIWWDTPSVIAEKLREPYLRSTNKVKDPSLNPAMEFPDLAGPKTAPQLG